MNRLRTFGALLMLTCLLAAGTAQASGPTGPRFTWPSFQRFWEKQASPLVYLTDAEAVEGGYLVDYGYTTTLRANFKEDNINSVEIRFLGGPGNDAGGPQFKRLMHQAISVGTYHWPEDKIAEVRELFAVITPEAKEFRYQMTHFKYSYTEGTGWFFSFEYVPDLQNPGGRAPLP